MTTLGELRKTTRASLCTACAKCATSCPLDGFAGFSPMRMVMVAEEDVREQVGPAQQCLTCSLCELRCPQGVHISDFARGLREVVPVDYGESCPHGSVVQVAAQLGDRAPARDLSWLDEGLRVAEQGEVALFVGCLPLFDAMFSRQFGIRTIEIAKAAIGTLNRLGIEPVVVAEERCCGHDLLWGGDQEAFTAVAEANAAAFQARGVELILTTCAECCRTWRLDYPDAVPGYQPRVQHLVEFLDDRLQAGELSFAAANGKETVTYQDPCRLGRQLGVLEAPRRVLGAVPGVDLVEMDHSGADAVCCGTAGFTHCDAASRRLQQERLESAAATGAATLVTACPKCLIHFACAQAEDRRRERPSPALVVEDLTLLTARMLAGPGGGERTRDGSKDDRKDGAVT